MIKALSKQTSKYPHVFAAVTLAITVVGFSLVDSYHHTIGEYLTGLAYGILSTNGLHTVFNYYEAITKA